MVLIQTNMRLWGVIDMKIRKQDVMTGTAIAMWVIMPH
jgi:hypothetical protein